MTASAIRALLILGLLAASLALPVYAEPGAPPALSTPQLIEAAQVGAAIDAATANLYLAYALADYDKLPAEYRSSVPWDGTLPLLHLQQAASTMAAGPARTEIEALLSETCSDSTASLPKVSDSSNFHIEYGDIYGGLTINHYQTSLETTWTKEVTTFGWAAPPVSNSNPPPGNRYHVRIDNLGSGLYGYVSSSGAHAGFVGNNPNTTWDDVDAYASCMVLNRNYDGFPGSAQQALDATTAHEFNHSIQFGYGALTGGNAADDALVEGGATWMEDEAFDNANDNYNYLWPTFARCLGEYTPSPYPYWITFRGLTERYGTGSAGAGEQVMQDFWELTSQSATSNMLPALNTALANKGTTLAQAYHAYAIAVKFNKTCGGGYVYPYCFEEAAGYVANAGATAVHGAIAGVGNSTTGSLPDNYALNWISLPAGGGYYQVTLRNTSAGGSLRGSVVCDTGSALSVTPFPAVVGAGGNSSIASFNSAGCSSVVAVLTNQAQTADNPTSCTSRGYKIETASATPPPSYDNRAFLPNVIRAYPPAAEVPVNGDFEDGPTGWTEYSSHGYTLILPAADMPLGARGGSWAVWLGRDDDELSYIQQQVTVPYASPYLTYWHWIDSIDWCGYDMGRVVVDGAIVDDYDLCFMTDTAGWVEHVVDLSAYAGQSVTLRIQAETDESTPSNLFVDDISFQSGAAAVQGD